jgi:hypothetical protein
MPPLPRQPGGRTGPLHPPTCGLLHLAIRTAVIAAITGSAVYAAAAEPDAPPATHIRTSSPAIAALIHDASVRSATFRQIVETIDASDGIVYVEEGKCGHSVRACLVLGIAVSGPNRLLRVLIDPRKADWDLQGSIGHELRHAIEVLSNLAVRSNGAMYNFFARGEGSHQVGGFETEAAIRAGEAVRAELRAHR